MSEKEQEIVEEAKKLIKALDYYRWTLLDLFGHDTDVMHPYNKLRDLMEE